MAAAAKDAQAIRDELAELPTGLKPKTFDAYAEEWRKYEKFVLRKWSTVSTPGKDEPWNAFVLWKYMLHRSEKCKPTTVFSSVSALAHFGTLHGHVLPTQRWDGNPLFYRQLKNMKREISQRYRNKQGANGATYDVKRSTPIGAQSVSLLLSYFQVYDEASFLALPRLHRHHIVISMHDAAHVWYAFRPLFVAELSNSFLFE